MSKAGKREGKGSGEGGRAKQWRLARVRRAVFHEIGGEAGGAL